MKKLRQGPTIGARQRQRGAVLVFCLVFLAVLTMMGVSGMESTTLEERMASNMVDHELAFNSAESALQAISQVGMPSIIREIECEHTISIRDERGLNQYLQQCVMDNRPSRTWRTHPLMRDFLDAFRHVDVYRFPNPIWLILSAPKKTKLDGRHRLQAYLEPVSTKLVA